MKRIEIDWAQMRADADRAYALAIANGTHSETPPLTVCQGCRKWVRAIAYVTLDHKRLCRECDPSLKREDGSLKREDVKT